MTLQTLHRLVAATLLSSVALSGHCAGFTHPGTPLTLSDLATLKSYVDQGRQPWKSAYDQLKNDSKAKTTYVMAGPYATVSRAPDVNLWPWRNDMVAIWNLSRMWYFTGNPDYAKKAHDILMQWATVQTEFAGRESMLDLGDYAYMFVGGADILRGTWPDWTDTDTATVKAYFANVLIPASNPYGENMFGAANKGALALNALGLMAIFNDDTELLNRVVAQTRTLAHIGLRSSNDIGMTSATRRRSSATRSSAPPTRSGAIRRTGSSRDRTTASPGRRSTRKAGRRSPTASS
jgi:hypothetical protein